MVSSQDTSLMLSFYTLFRGLSLFLSSSYNVDMFQKPSPRFSAFIKPSRWNLSLCGFPLIWNSFIREVYILPRYLALPQTEASPAVSQVRLLPAPSQPQWAQSSIQGRRWDVLQKNVRPLPVTTWQRGGRHFQKVQFLSVAIRSSRSKDNTPVLKLKVPNHCLL